MRKGENMKISKRTEEMTYSAVRKLTPYADAAKKAGKKVYHLNIGAPDVVTPSAFFDAIGNFSERVLQYAPSKGIPELLSATSKYYKNLGINIDEGDIYITQGGSEALLFSLYAVTDLEDEVLTCNPFYSNYMSFIQMVGAKLTTFDTFVEDGYRLPAREKIEEKITPRTKAILLSNPSNPTGTVYTREEVELLASIAKDNGLFIIADEVYREFVFDGEKVTSFGEIEGIEENLLLLDSISKRFSACGARIGSIATKNKEVADSINKLCNGRLAAPTVEQVAAAALYEIDPKYYEEVREEYQKRRDTIYNELSKIEGVKVYKSKGAFYVMPTLPVDNTEDFAKWLLEEFDVDGETVMMAPGDGFYKDNDTGKNQVRLAFVLNSEDIIKAMKILAAGIEAYNQR